MYKPSSVFLIFLSGVILSCCNIPLEKYTQDPIIELDTTLIVHHSIPSSIRAIEAIDDQTCWFAGSKGLYGYTANGGDTWIIDSLIHPEHGALHFRSIAVTDDAVHILSIASPALLYRSTDMGDNWELVYEEHDSLAFYDAMAFWDEKNGIAMGDPTGDCLSIILTKDGGESWNKIPCDQLPPAADGEAAFAASNGNIALSGSNAWVVSGGKKSRVFHSPDYGKSWKVYDTPITQGGAMTGIFACDFFDTQTGMIIGGDWEKMENNSDNKAITKDGGQTWHLIANGANPGYQSCVQYLSESSSNPIMSVGIPGISLSNDGGQSWDQLSDEGFYTLRKADKVIWMAGNNKIARWPIILK